MRGWAWRRCAAAVAAVETGRAERHAPLPIHLPGGTLTITVGAPGEPGVLHVHHVTEKLSRAQPDELERLLALLDEYS